MINLIDKEIQGLKVHNKGLGNVLFVEEGVKFENAVFTFDGNNSVIYISHNRHFVMGYIYICSDSLCYFGKDIYINERIELVVSEHRNVIIGDNCLLSVGICMRTADPHLIYSIETKQRINHSKSIYIGDHVWIGQNSFIGKGAKIGSGSVIGANSVVTKSVYSNSVYAGSPAKLHRRNVFWDERCTHKWDDNMTEANLECFDQAYIYNDNPESKNSFDMIEDKLCMAKGSSEKRIEVVLEVLKKDDKY